MTHQGMRGIFRDWDRGFFDTLNYLVLVMGILLLFAGCEDVQQLLAPVPAEDDDSTIKIGFIYTSDTRSQQSERCRISGTAIERRRWSA